MLQGRKPATRTLEQASLAEAYEGLFRQGFHEHDADDDRIVFKRPGTEFTVSAHKAPLEVVLRARPEGGVQMQLRYDTIVVFDTGDLETEADRIARVLSRPGS